MASLKNWSWENVTYRSKVWNNSKSGPILQASIEHRAIEWRSTFGHASIILIFLWWSQNDTFVKFGQGFKPREGVINVCYENNPFHGHCDVILMSQMAVIVNHTDTCFKPSILNKKDLFLIKVKFM